MALTSDLSHHLTQYIVPVCRHEMRFRLINVIGLINFSRTCILALNSRPVSLTYIQYTLIGLTTVLPINLSSTCLLDVTPDLSHQLTQYIVPVCRLEMSLCPINVIGLINLPRTCILALTPGLFRQLTQYIVPVCRHEMRFRLINVIGLINFFQDMYIRFKLQTFFIDISSTCLLV